MFHGKSQQLQIGNKTAPGFDMVIFDTAPTGALAQISISLQRWNESNRA